MFLFQHSEDSGKGSSPRSELATTYEFIIPQTCVGRLIGRNGVFVNKIKSFTGANILIKNHPENLSKYKICAIDGLQTEIDAALVMIREKFPEKKYPNLTLQRVSFPPAVLTPEISPECVSVRRFIFVNYVLFEVRSYTEKNITLLYRMLCLISYIILVATDRGCK